MNKGSRWSDFKANKSWISAHQLKIIELRLLDALAKKDLILINLLFSYYIKLYLTQGEDVPLCPGLFSIYNIRLNFNHLYFDGKFISYRNFLRRFPLEKTLS